MYTYLLYSVYLEIIDIQFVCKSRVSQNEWADCLYNNIHIRHSIVIGI